MPLNVFAQSDKRDVKYVGSFSLPPYRQVTAYGDFVGFEVDIANLLFRNSEYSVKFADLVYYGSNQNAFSITRADCFAWLPITEEYEPYGLFTDRILDWEFHAYSLSKNKLKLENIEDLRGLHVAVREKSPLKAVLKGLGIPYVAMMHPELEVAALISGEVDVVFDERRTMEYFFSKRTHMGDIETHEKLQKTYPAGIAFNPHRADLQEFANVRLKEIKENGEFEALYYQYFGEHTAEYWGKKERERETRTIAFISTLSLLVVGFIAAQFIFAKRRAEQKKRLNDERYKLLLNEADIMLMDFDESGMLLAYSESTVRLLDIPLDLKNFRNNFRKCIHPDDLTSYTYEADKLYSGESTSMVTEIRMRTTAKNYEYFLIKARRLSNDNGKHRVCGIGINISDQKLLEEQMEKSLSFDGLTGAMNRGKFISVSDSIMSAKPNDAYALICLDVDHLSKINNICGFAAGDSVLKQMAAAVMTCLDSQMIFGRLGSDDFAILFHSKDKNDAQALFARISDEVAKISVGRAIRIPVRIHGGAAYHEENDNILSLLTKANAAQQVAKTRGEPIVDYEQGVRLLTLDREELSEDLVDAYENGDFDIWYQPKVELSTRKLMGMEALLRWKHPKKGDVPPSVFIELAEQSGFIQTLDIWVITQACRQNKIWQDRGLPPVRMSANLSKKLFEKTDLVKTITDILKETGLDSQYLDIEVTESLAVSDPEITAKVLTELRETGITVSMDDFGSGYASLGTLKQLPFDTLKIDRSLIIDIDKNETSQQIAKAIMDIANSIKLTVVAEGAETHAQIEYLEKLNCHIVQGFYFGKPVPVEQFEENFKKFK